MKALHITIIIILLVIFGTTAESYGQMVENDLGDGNVFNIKAKDRGLPSDIIEINGNLVTKDPIKIILNDPNGIIRKSITTFADRNGDFTTELKIPADATAGTWKIIGNSGIYHQELNFTVIGNSATDITCYWGSLCQNILQQPVQNNTSTCCYLHRINPTIMQSPLKQFKSGIPAQTVECALEFQLILKTEDGSPACVKPDTANILIKRGWAKITVTIADFNVRQ